MKKLLIYTAIALLSVACDSEDAWDILKTRGDRKVETRTLTAFTGITVYNGINVVLEKADSYEAVLDGWSNLLAKVDLSINSDGVLTIEDNNKFDFVRNPDNKTTIHLFYDGEINAITSHSDGLISNIDTLYTSGLTILSEDASGTIELTVKTPGIGIGTNNRNVGDIKLRGISSYLGITNWGNAPIYAEELEVENCDIIHRGTGNLHLNVTNILNVEIYSIGDVYYKNNPTVTINRKGKGNVYRLQ